MVRLVRISKAVNAAAVRVDGRSPTLTLSIVASHGARAGREPLVAALNALESGWTGIEVRIVHGMCSGTDLAC